MGQCAASLYKCQVDSDRCTQWELEAAGEEGKSPGVKCQESVGKGHLGDS